MKKILYVGSECMPFAAAGGLGDVMGSLPEAVKEEMGPNCDVRVAVPLYGCVDKFWREQMTFVTSFTVRLGWRNQYCGILSIEKNGVIYYFIDNEYYFKRDGIYGHYDDGERFAFFNMAVMQMMGEVDFFPHILHANDWQSALSVVYHSLLYKEIPGYDNIKTVFTIHNVEYQGKYCMETLNELFSIPWKNASVMEYDGMMNLMKAAVQCADVVSTVSPRYAEEIMTPEYGCGLDGILRNNAHKVIGILNGNRL